MATEVDAVARFGSVVRSSSDHVACEACHRIGSLGNAGPGPNLTHVGATLSTRGIEKAIVDPSEPMPSFEHLPAEKLKAIIEFLSLLR